MAQIIQSISNLRCDLGHTNFDAEHVKQMKEIGKIIQRGIFCECKNFYYICPICFEMNGNKLKDEINKMNGIQAFFDNKISTSRISEVPLLYISRSTCLRCIY